MSFYDDDAFDWDSVAQATDRLERQRSNNHNQTHNQTRHATTFFVCPDCGFKPDDGSSHCDICAGSSRNTSVRRKAPLRAPLAQVPPQSFPKNYTQSKLNLLIPSRHPSAEKPKHGEVAGPRSNVIDLSGSDDLVPHRVSAQIRQSGNRGYTTNMHSNQGGDEGDPTFVKHVYDERTVMDYLYPHSDKYACREYQSKIVKSALLMNTLVVLPTGLGKTFIAAVVMCNYLRWFPKGKIIFMAPTRPLVTQQIEACHNIVGIDESVTAQLMGSVKPEKRAQLWQSKRLFYCTPQTAEKDAKNNYLPARDVVLLVIDEAHRATGNYAYTNVVRHIRSVSRCFRVLSLSATPGKNAEKVQEVINNLLVAKVEYKSESDPDVKPYVFNKCIEVRSVKATKESIELTEMLHALARPVLSRICNNPNQSVPLRRDLKKLTKHQVLMAQKLFMTTNTMSHATSATLGDLGLLFTLLSLKELMVVHGLTSVSEQIRRSLTPPFSAPLSRAKQAMIRSHEWKKFVARLTVCRKSSSANPKANELIKILREHFARYKEAGKNTSVIVFTQFRTSVCELVDAITQLTDLTASPFVGQSNNSTKSKSKDASKEELEREESVAITGQNQRQQQEVVQRFRSNEIDVLVATSIGEEGLDIGSVDLIISFDALASPVRMIQRFGRAGRKRSGKVICLVAEGKEKDTLTAGTAKSQRVHNLLRKTPHRLFLYQQNPRMLPGNGCPVINNFRFEIRSFRSSQIAGRSKVGRAKKSATSSKSNESTGVSSLVLSSKEKQHYLQNLKCDKDFAFSITDALARPNIENLRNHHVVGHSSRTLLLKRVLGYITEQSNGVKAWLEDDVPKQANIRTSTSTDELEFAKARKSPAIVDLEEEASKADQESSPVFELSSMSSRSASPEREAKECSVNQVEHEKSSPVEQDDEEEEPLRFDDDFAVMSAEEEVAAAEASDNGSLFGDIIPPPPGVSKSGCRGECTVCGSFSERLLACVDCGVRVHGSCVNAACSAMWRCNVCKCLSKNRKPSCELCAYGREHGVMIEDSELKRWVHVSCAVWTAGAQCTIGERGVKEVKLDATRRTGDEKCCFCGGGGACAVCSDPCCTEQYHPSCGVKEGLRFKLDRIYPTSYCKAHSEAASLRCSIDSEPDGSKHQVDESQTENKAVEVSSRKAVQVEEKDIAKSVTATKGRTPPPPSFQARQENVADKQKSILDVNKEESKQQPKAHQSRRSSLVLTPIATNGQQGSTAKAVMAPQTGPTNAIALTTPLPPKEAGRIPEKAASTIIKAPKGAVQHGRRRRNLVDSDSESGEDVVNEHKKVAGGWTCKRCTLVNQRDDSGCGACGLRRQPIRKNKDVRHPSNEDDDAFHEEGEAEVQEKPAKKKKKRKLKRARDDRQHEKVKAASLSLFEQEAEVSGDDSGDGAILEDLDQDLEGFVVEDGEGEDCSDGVDNIYRRSLMDSCTPTPRLLKRGRAMCVDMPVIANELKRLKAQTSDGSPAPQAIEKDQELPAMKNKEDRSSLGASQRDSLGCSIRQRIEENKRKALERRQRKALAKQQQQQEASPQAIDLTQAENAPLVWCRGVQDDDRQCGEFCRQTLQVLVGTVQDIDVSVQSSNKLQGADVVIGTRCCILLCETSECGSRGMEEKISLLKELYKDIVIVARIGSVQLGHGDLIQPVAKGCRMLLVNNADDAVNGIRRLAASEDAHDVGLRSLEVDSVVRKCSQSESLGRVMKFLCSARGMNVVVICCMIKHFKGRSLGEMIAQMKAKVLMQAAPGLTSQQAAWITSYFTRRCRG